MHRRSFLKAMGAAACAPFVRGATTVRPNIIFILTDDLGYGDLRSYGSRIPTPNIDRLATEGVRFGQFYAPNAVCSPSRAGILTGRYGQRVGVPGVLMPDAEKGLSLSDPTIAEVLKPAGYTTACIGKWHVGSLPQFMPNARGFDYFFGLPYSHDMLPLPLMRNRTVLQHSPRTETLTRTWTDEALRFINGVHKDPFFLYLAHTAPHLPLAVSAPFRRKTKLGRYADTVAELDWSVGQVLDALAARNLENNTLVTFTSDNGPWYMGSTGGLSGRKGQTFEGGLRVPLLARMPGVIPAATTVKAMATGLDMMPTFARMAGVAPPAAARDGVDIMPLLTGASQDVDRPPFLYFDRNELQCIRSGNWKLHVSRYNALPWGPEPVGGRWNLPLLHPELYDLNEDPDESSDCAADNPDVVADLQAQIQAELPSFPSVVMNAWRDTQSRKVIDTPSGALPVRATT